MSAASPDPSTHHQSQQQKNVPFDGCSMPPAPPYDVTAAQRAGNGVMTSPRLVENSAPSIDSGSSAGSATVSVSIVHNIDSSCLYNQAKGEIKLTFSSTLSAPIAPSPSGSSGPDQLRHESACSPSSAELPCEPTLPRTSNWTTPSTRTMTSVNGNAAPTTSSINEQQTISEADDIISEFLGQINATFDATSTVDHRTSCPPRQPTLDGARYSSDTGSGSKPTLKLSPSQVIPSAMVADNRHFPVVSDRPDASTYQVSSYRHVYKRPEADRTGDVPRPMVGTPYRPTYSGYPALRDYDMPTSGRSGNDIATGPAAETLKKMAAMHRSMYEKTPALPSSDTWYHSFPTSGFNSGRNLVGQYVEYGKAPTYHQHSQHRQQQQQPPPYDVNICTPTFGHSSSLPVQSTQAPSKASYNNDNNNGAMKPLSHYPDMIGPAMTPVTGSATGGGKASQSSLGRRPERIVRVTQKQNVTVQQNFHVGSGRNERQNEQRFHIDATQTQRVQIRLGPEVAPPYPDLVPPKPPLGDQHSSFWKPEVYPQFECRVPTNGLEHSTDGGWFRHQQPTPSYGSPTEANGSIEPFCGGSTAPSFVSSSATSVPGNVVGHGREKYLPDHKPTMMMTMNGGHVAPPMFNGRQANHDASRAFGGSSERVNENGSTFRRGSQYNVFQSNDPSFGTSSSGTRTDVIQHQTLASDYGSPSPTPSSVTPNASITQHQFDQRYSVQQHQQIHRWNSLPVALNNGDTSKRCSGNGGGTGSLVQSPYGVMDFRSCEEDNVIDMVPIDTVDFLPGSCFDRTPAVVSGAEVLLSSPSIVVSSSNGMNFIDEIFGNR